MNLDEQDDDFEPQFAEVPEGQELVLDLTPAEQDGHLRRAAIGITAGVFNNMVVLPRSAAGPLLRAIHAEALPFGGYVGQFNGNDVEIHHLDIVTPTCDRFWPEVTEFLYGPLTMLESALAAAQIEPAPLPSDFMDPFERGLARYAIYGQ